MFRDIDALRTQLEYVQTLSQAEQDKWATENIDPIARDFEKLGQSMYDIAQVMFSEIEPVISVLVEFYKDHQEALERITNLYKEIDAE